MRKQLNWIAALLLVTGLAHGAIDATAKYAWSENAGWINFAPTHGGVTVESAYLSGYAWCESVGWIKLGSGTGPYTNTTSANWGVNVGGGGVLSGYAWSENSGWINFAPTHGGVTIGTNGKFDGYAWSETLGFIRFDKNASHTVINTVPIAFSNMTITFNFKTPASSFLSSAGTVDIPSPFKPKTVTIYCPRSGLTLNRTLTLNPASGVNSYNASTTSTSFSVTQTTANKASFNFTARGGTDGSLYNLLTGFGYNNPSPGNVNKAVNLPVRVTFKLDTGANVAVDTTIPTLYNSAFNVSGNAKYTSP